MIQLATVCDHRVLPREGGVEDHTGEARIAIPRRAQVDVVVDPAANRGGYRVERDVLVLETGGPYEITVRARGVDHRASDVLVGDVWALAGQSNMAGGGELDERPEPIDGVRLLGFDEQWQPAVEPFHRIWCNPRAPILKSARREVHGIISDEAWAAICAPYFAQEARGPVGGVGPGSSFARELYQRTGVPIGVVPCALGSTTLYAWRRAWHTTLAVPIGDTLYGNLLARARRAGPVRGIAWYQGEGDSGPDRAPSYLERFQGMVAELREDLGNPALPFVTAQLCRYEPHRIKEVYNEDVDPAAVGGWPLVRDAQRRAADADPRIALIATADLPLGDGVHLDRAGVEEAGRRMAVVAEQFVPGHSGRSSPRLADVRATADGRAIRVRFSDLDGELVMSGPCDVAVDAGGKPVKVKSVKVDGDALVVSLSAALPAGATLTYGPGLAPEVNLFDKAGMPVPLFGPVEVRDE